MSKFSSGKGISYEALKSQPGSRDKDKVATTNDVVFSKPQPEA